jgi:hypothetical protein
MIMQRQSLPTPILLVTVLTLIAVSSFAHAANWLNGWGDTIEEKLHQQAPDLGSRPLHLALQAYHCALKHGKDQKHILSIIDFSQPSSHKRLWVFDMNQLTLLHHTTVAHGKGSGFKYSTRFSNTKGSKASSLGTMLTGQTYYGHRGYSLRLHGLVPGINGHIFKRHVVMHPAWYASAQFLRRYGRLGRSWGCPALAPAKSRQVINTIKNHTIVFAYYPNDELLADSNYLNCEA